MVVAGKGAVDVSDSAGDSYRCYLSMNWMGKWESNLASVWVGFANVLQYPAEARRKPSTKSKARQDIQA